MQDRSLRLNQGGTGCKLLTECKGEIVPNEMVWRKAAWTSDIFFLPLQVSVDEPECIGKVLNCSKLFRQVKSI